MPSKQFPQVASHLAMPVVKVQSDLGDHAVRDTNLRQSEPGDRELSHAEDANAKLLDSDDAAPKLPDSDYAPRDHRYAIGTIFKRNVYQG